MVQTKKGAWAYNYDEGNWVWVLTRVDGIDSQMPGVVVGRNVSKGEVYVSVMSGEGVSHVAITDWRGIAIRPKGVISIAGKAVGHGGG